MRLQLAEKDRQIADLKGGGGDGTFDGMDHRVSRLEHRLDKLGDGLGEVEVKLATLNEKVSHLPSKSYIDTRLLIMLAVIAALVAFADKIQAFFG
ncbi:hypothetical protein AB433_07430 [Croceicoccus naphthovorans]|uniref:Uncharacterized protein n=2 Tax=Croceicoccus naphthovorans TaxID=1348774 RepID=A0A0G3XGT6_9SPHN|nr:hypothetical protein AB433_07430 [Croceicoccus naphthovorans]